MAKTETRKSQLPQSSKADDQESVRSRLLPNRPRPLSSFDTHARWQPVTQSARSRRSYGKIGDCEQSSLIIQNEFEADAIEVIAATPASFKLRSLRNR